ncbi:putative heterokaryon incompatibility [Septoria linicola]|nr:putative heterokaryon incompatibility [Septoria linicola]
MDKRASGLRSSFLRRLQGRQMPEDVPSQVLIRQPTTTGHKYEPLPKEGNFIRLLKFKKKWQRGSRSDVLRFDFVSAELRDNKQCSVDYYAISYAWGANPGLAPIVLNGQRVLIPDSAEAALRGIIAQLGSRSANRMQPIWIDAVCINPDDLNEKQRQAGKMGKVFSTAKIVFVWLGLDDGTAKAGFKSLRLLAKQQGEFDSADLGEQDRMEWALPPGIDQDSLEFFLDCPWFTRLWVLQEVALGQLVILVRGARKLSWTDFHRSISRIYDTETLSSFSHAKVVPPFMIADLHRDTQGTTLNHSLHFAFLFTTSDPRDKIYGILGLLENGQAEHTQSPGPMDCVTKIQPDYTRPLLDVFREATLLALEGATDLQILLLAQLMVPLPEALLDQWSSWVPRYHESNGLVILPIGSGNVNPGVKPHYSLDASGETILKVRGLCVQSIKAIKVADQWQVDIVEDFLRRLWTLPRSWQIQDLVSLLKLCGLPEKYLSDLGAYLLEHIGEDVPEYSELLEDVVSGCED